ncbi:hypothetical protein A3J20_05850 [Candidatus Gottesmanbacteria bacterium RIFCSPLOWO2_02_FULL_42_29]|nr:MAG: hypothetical protein A3J20_05850 [Candidatus Gottesmanbacteria bacterium RIFCSPLOWO2_02_FULL_42_29]
MPADTDLGWHLKYGEYFQKTGNILRDNIFSLEMPSYKWANSSWLTDIITYSVYKEAGFLGLTIAGGIIIVLIFYFLNKALKFSIWEKAFIFPLLFYLEEPLLRVSFRGQLLSILLTAVLIYILTEFQKGHRKIIYFSAPLFLLWSNLHGGFLLGLAVLSLFYFLCQLKLIIYKNYEEFRNNLNFLPAVIISFLTVLINPYGLRVYSEVIKHFGNPYQKYIMEWLPLPPFSTLWWLLFFWGVFMILNVRTIIGQQKFRDYFEWIFITLVFFTVSFWMRRYAWTMYLLSVPIAVHYFKDIKPLRENFLSKFLPPAIFTLIYLYAILYHIPNQHLTAMNWNRFCREFIKCSPQSAEYLRINKPQGKFLSNYNWGGWLIWNYPEIKPSIDGRMHLWRDEKGTSAFAEYYFLEQDVNDIEESDYDVVYMWSEKPLFNKMIKLSDQGKWKTVYKDDRAGIFVRNK